MISRTNTAPIVRLPVRHAHASVLSLFARFMALAARVLYFLGIDNDIVQACARSRSARGVGIGVSLGMVSVFDDKSSSICTLDVWKTLRTREHLMTRVQLAPPSPALFNQ